MGLRSAVASMTRREYVLVGLAYAPCGRQSLQQLPHAGLSVEWLFSLSYFRLIDYLEFFPSCFWFEFA
jgi:hypothetical protein